ncbi:unnamed protein product [Lepeophtheirus salmonis]|uniref:(salmon louse) hypothetical protein n=1 Tax=Lepeophtheirus salmonis TaxID=72036 RepID=A0A817FBV7_LEPSM|nr:unnamed protein product [Lepeophtheirus salmonis]
MERFSSSRINLHPIPPKSAIRSNTASDTLAVDAETEIETIVLDGTEIAEVEIGPMIIPNSPTSLGSPQTDTIPASRNTTLDPAPKSPTLQDIGVGGLNLLERIKIMIKMMNEIEGTDKSPSDVPQVVERVIPCRPDPEYIKVLEDKTSGVDLESLIPELMAIVAASMVLGGINKYKDTTSEDEPNPQTSFLFKRGKLIVERTTLHYPQKTCYKIIV